MALVDDRRVNFKNPVIRWIDDRLPIFSMMHHEYREYPMPRNVNYFWNFGAIATVILIVMIVTGITLAMHYTAHVDYAFDSVERIMRDVNYGWLIRYLHANGASMFFIAVYIHMFRALYYGSYKSPRELYWITGLLLLILMMAAAYFGYVLPWGQMSLWGAVVITNVFSAIPLIGDELVVWIQGGYSVDNPTLTRFFAFHYLVPFLILGLVVLHVAALHKHGSNNPLGINVSGPQDTLPFHPYFTAKDTLGISVFLIFYAVIVFFYPNIFQHPDNYIPADPLVTPAHIVPEWYLLPFYAMLRAVPSKLGGVVVLAASIGILFFLPWLDTSKVRSARFRPLYRQFIWLLVLAVIILGMAGARPPEGGWVVAARVATIYYFFHFLVLLPLLGKFERPRPLPRSIMDRVLPPVSHEEFTGPGQKMETVR